MDKEEILEKTYKVLNGEDWNEAKEIREKELKSKTKGLIAKYSATPRKRGEFGVWDVQRAGGDGHRFKKQGNANIYGLLLTVLERLDDIEDKLEDTGERNRGN